MFVIFLVMTPMFVHGQAISGNLTGTVADPSGAVVNGAKVEATNDATGQTVSTTTRGNGEYVFANLPIGTYKISVSLPNFKTTTVDRVPVELNKTNNANVKMEVGSSSTTVEVSGEAPSVDTATAQLQTTYDDQLAQDLWPDIHRWHRCRCFELIDVESGRNKCKRDGPWHGSVSRGTAAA
jgi:hypothetical protein